MEKILKMAHPVWAGECNAEGELSLSALTMDILTLSSRHADILGVGNAAMPGRGWVLSRLTFDMQRFPVEGEVYELSTWIESWNRHFSERCYSISLADGTILGYARAVWMVINISDHSSAGLDHLTLAEDITGVYPCPIRRQGKQVVFTDADEVMLYKVVYSDLDYYRHVNTIRHIQLLLNSMPLDRMDACRIERFEVAFMHEATYGEELRLSVKHISPFTTAIHVGAEGKELLRSTIYLRQR